MKDDYLWDKSGEPDPQIQELEEILGSLKYKPRPLVIPADLLAPRRRSYRPLIAIAAALLFALLATAVWIGMRQSETPIPDVVRNESTPGPTPEDKPKESPKTPDEKKPSTLAVNKPRRLAPKVRRPEPEAEMAKEQIMLAIKLASEKFNQASRRTQTPNQIRNQHKIG